MFFISPLRRAVAAFFLLLFFAVVASAVCVAFGANAIPSLAPGAHQETVLRTPEFALGAARRANTAGSQAEAALRGKPSAAALHVAGSASRAGVGT